MLNNEYPIVSFYFRLQILGDPITYSFQDISGIKRSLDTEAISEGGENRFQHHLPVKRTYSPLVLKRGVISMLSPLSVWLQACSSFCFDQPMVAQTLLLTLLDESGIPSIMWTFNDAIPTEHEFSKLNSQDNELLYETITLKYKDFTMVPLI